MSRDSVTIEGLPGLKAALERKVSELRASSRLAVLEETKLIEADARNHAPKDSGELKDGITSETLDDVGTIHTTAKHSAAMEFGTFKDAAQPFMTPAAELARRRFPKRAADIIRNALGG